MLIDIHAHPTFSDFAQAGHAPPDTLPKGAKLDVVTNPHTMGLAMAMTSKQYKGARPAMMSVDEFIEHVDDSHTLVTFLCPANKGVPARHNNERAAKLIQRFRGRAIGFAGFDPTSDDPVGDIDHAVNTLGFSGLKCIASLFGVDINDPILYPCYEKAQDLGVPITLHTGAGLIMGCRVKHVRPILVDDVAFDFPDLKINCSHLGCWDFMDVHSLLLRHPNVYSDLSAWPLDERYTDVVPWKLLEETVPDKLMLGSDYPAAQTPAEAVQAVMKLPIGDEFRRKILGLNAARFLNLGSPPDALC